MFMDACSPVNDSGTNSPVERVERPYIDPVPCVLPVPGEDGEPQSVSNLAFHCCLGLVVLGLLIIWWPILQAVRL